MKRPILLFLTCTAAFLFAYCTVIYPPSSGNDNQDYIQIRLAQMNFGGDWNYLYNDGFDTIELTNPWIGNFRREIKMEYDDNRNTPSTPSLDTTSIYTYKNNGFTIELNWFDSQFKNNDWSFNAYNDEFNWKLKNGSLNDLTFSYNIDNWAFSGIKTTIYIPYNAPAILRLDDPSEKYSAEVEIVHEATTSKDFSKTINIVVMADGYTMSEIDYFERYVRDAFKDPSSFHWTKIPDYYTHEHIQNKFFKNYWDSINVIMVKTISAYSGITVVGQSYKDSILGVRYDREKDTNYKFGSWYNISAAINKNFEKIGLAPHHIDVVIILVNQVIRSYASIGSGDLADRNYQPINTAIISAPSGYDVNSSYFHNYVDTDKIAHELGHALARLMDEYIEVGKDYNYYSSMRNVDLISNAGYPKWQGLRYYNSGFFTNSEPVKDTDHRIGNFVGSYYSPDKYIRPTFNSTMEGTMPSTDYQFGPVNTYHLEGSFRTRMGMLYPQDPGYRDFSYEWWGYDFHDFAREYRESDFNY